MAYQNIEHIFAGQLKAGTAKSTILQAHLGTCVGVALYDSVSKVGGLIHILLPEPPGIASALFPEKYASTGIPMLISQLTQLGASPENLTASIAGGALVGPVSRQDMNLDIGGRSSEIAADLLKAAGIQTVKSETGGFFSCTLELDMITGVSTIKPALDLVSEPQNTFCAPSLANILDTIDQLKPIPQTALKILRLFQSGHCDVKDITNELAKDQVLSGQTLKLCNSPLFSGMVKIDTLKEAVLLLGEEMLIKSVITAAVNTYYSQTGTSGYSLCKGGLFFHAVGVASAAEKIAEKSDKPNLKLAYTAGLLHDIGKVILDQYVAESAPLFFRELSRKNENFIRSEKKLLGITHSEAGAILARKWNFSTELFEVIQLHHTPEKTKTNKDLAYTIYLADLLMGKFNAGYDLEKMQGERLVKALDHLGFTITDLPELVDSISIQAFNSEDT